MAFDAIETMWEDGAMKAKLVVRDQKLFADGYFWEVVIWQTPENVPTTTHGYKYRLFYGRAGERVIGYDNERGKGDHRHYRNMEEGYYFTSIIQLLEDFEADVEKERGESS